MVVGVLVSLGGVAGASGPRWVTGPPYFTGAAGVPVGWSVRTLTYFTDSGDLSVYVNHAAADAMVAAAAAVWNVPVANLTLAKGGVLAEHVSGADVYLSTSGLVYPADVMSSNYSAVPIAVVYDSDGSVTDALLGAGASNPLGCRENGVTESVDLFDPAGYILHAVVVVNGRCTGSAPQAQMQLQYQLERVFGRVLGLAWTQTNDNVFSGTPTPTAAQAANWPVMHPVDILCGPYTYQCMPQPFQLRPDDVASMVLLYGIGANAVVPAGKQVSLANATGQTGRVMFPTGEGMAGVNVLLNRIPGYTNVEEGWATASAVTGTTFRRIGGNPVMEAGTDAVSSGGTTDPNQQGAFDIAYIPMPDGMGLDNHVLTFEPVNPLYIGMYALGPYAPGAVAPSGTPMVPVQRYVYPQGVADAEEVVADAAPQCGTGTDGTEALPAAADPTGWWQGLLCGWGHASWVSVEVQANRTLTLDVTALDELGEATTTKAMPVMGAWSASDSTGTMPTLGATQVAFNAASVGTSRMQVSTTQAGGLRMVIADERGEGRPDFTYQARVLYADSVVPAAVTEAGGVVTVAGMGFRAGNSVTVNGVEAKVTSWTSTSMAAQVPAMALAAATAGVPVDVVVRDLSTGATSTMYGALTYSSSASLPMVMKLVSGPSGTLFAGDASSVAFTVQVLGGDGVTPVAGETVTLSATSGTVEFAACGAASCVLTTDASGMVSSVVVPQAAGAVTLQALDGAMSVQDSLTAVAGVGSLQLQSAPSGSVAMETTAGVGFRVQALQPDGYGAAGVPVMLTASPAGSVRFEACGATSCEVLSDIYGFAESMVTPLTTGAITLTATADKASVGAGFFGVESADRMTIVLAPGASVPVGQRAGLVVSLTASDGVTPLFGRSVVFTAPPGVIFDACGASTCTLVTNWSGASMVVIPQVPGTYTVQVNEVPGPGVESNVVTAMFTTPAAGTFLLNVVSVPANGAVIGQVAALPFTVQALAPDGVTPLVNEPIAIGPVQPGAALVTACWLTPCRVSTDANGMVSTGVIPLIAGPIAIQALDNPVMQQATFVASAAGANVMPAQGVEYVAEGVAFGWTMQAETMLNGVATPGVLVNWTGSTGFAVGAGTTASDWTGWTALGGTIGPLAAGARASVEACAWSSVCTEFDGVGVAAESLRIQVASGAGQAVGAPGSFQPVVLEVTDEAGHPVAGATVTVWQTVTAGASACPVRGGCPVAPVERDSVSSGVSDVNGLLSVAPLSWNGGAATTHVAASVGTQGFTSVELTWTP